MLRVGFRGGILAALTGALLLASTGVAQAQVSGAIFTTDTGGTTDANIYTAKSAVYLNGGPRHPGAAGLPDGQYFAKVTEPNGDPLGDPLDTPPITVAGGKFVAPYQLIAIVKQHSDGNAGFDNTTNAGGEYKVWVSKDPSFPESASKTDNFKVFETTPDPVHPHLTLSGLKFYDKNANGKFEDGQENGVAGIKIDVYINGVLTYTTTTGTFGDWAVGPFEVNEGDTYEVCERVPLSTVTYTWVQSAPKVNENGDRCYVGTVTNTDAVIPGLNFGNYCFTPAVGGLTLGYWSNKNGQNATTQDDVDYLRNSLCLRNANGSEFNPLVKTELPSWLLNANAVNMAYMLSAQLTATTLDTRHTGLLTSTVLYLGNGTDLANCYGANVANLGGVMAAANQQLCDNANTTADPFNRPIQECLKNILDAVNNNRLQFVPQTPCPVTYP